MNRIRRTFVSLRAAYTNRSDPEGMQVLARMLWRISLTLGIFVIVAGMAYGIYILLDVLGTFSNKSAVKVNTAPLFQKSKLESSLKAFDDRTERFQAIQSTTTVHVDPSVK